MGLLRSHCERAHDGYSTLQLQCACSLHRNAIGCINYKNNVITTIINDYRATVIDRAVKEEIKLIILEKLMATDVDPRSDDPKLLLMTFSLHMLFGTATEPVSAINY